MEADKSLVSGSMALLVLKLLEDGDKYGYQMTQRAESTVGGRVPPEGGDLYPCSTRWRKRAWSPPMSGRPRPASPGGTIT